MNYELNEESICPAALDARCSVLSLDTETTGLMPFHGDKVFSTVLSDGVDSFYIEGMPIWLRGLLARFDLKLYIHNSSFDLHMLTQTFGVEINCQIHDTLVGARIEYNDHMTYSLDDCAERIGLHKSDEVEKFIKENSLWEWQVIPGKKTRRKNKFFNKVDRDVMVKYACQDALITYKLGDYQDKRIRQIDLLLPDAPKLYNILQTEKKLVPVVVAMENHGVLIDKEYCNKAIEHYTKVMKENEHGFGICTGHNYKASPKLFENVFASEKHRFTFTEKGNPSFESEVLEKFEHPAAKHILQMRNAKSRLDFFSGFLFHSDLRSYVHPSFKSGGTATGRFSSSEPNCLSVDTEVLTDSGWKNYRNLNLSDSIFCYDTSSGELQLNKPNQIYVSTIKQRELVRARNVHFDMLLTKDHRTLFRNRKTGCLSTVPAEHFLKDSHVLHGAPHYSAYANQPPLDKILFAVAVQADGHVKHGKDGHLQITLSFLKPRKILRLKILLDRLGVKYRQYTKGSVGLKRITTFYLRLPGDYFFGLLTQEKEFDWNLLKLNPSAREAFLMELRYWDGLYTREPLYYASKKQRNVSIVQALASISGYRVKISHYRNATGGRAYICYGTARDYSGTANVELSVVPLECRVWCLKVPTGYFLARRNGRTFITGNCQNMSADDENQEEAYPVRRAILPPPGFSLVSIDYSQQEYRLMLDYAGEMAIIEQVLGGADIHQATADMMGVSRKYAKTLNFALLYGSGVANMADLLGVSENQARDLRNLYFSRLPNVQKFIKRVVKTAEARGYVYNWAGRRYFSSRDMAYKMPNRVIQGGGADIIKIAMVRIHELLKPYKSKMVLTIHDELGFYIHDDEHHLVPEIEKIMCSAYPAKHLPLTVSVSHSYKSFGDLQDGPPVHRINHDDTREKMANSDSGSIPQNLGEHAC